MRIGEFLSERVRLWFVAVATALLLPTVALGQRGADELASTIEQSLQGIEFRLDIRPQQAATDLEVQGRQIALLEEQAPDHPALPQIKKKFAELQDGLAAALASAASDAATGGGGAAELTVPRDFTTGMEQVNALHRQAETEFLQGEPDQAAEHLAEAEAQLAALEQRYGDELPPGHVPLIVTKEKIAALKDQLATQ